MFSILRPLRALAKALRANDSPRQLAIGVALGMVIGLVPKGNLIAAALLFVLLASKINRGSGLCSAFFCSWIGMFLDPISHRLGFVILNIRSLEPFYAWLADLPVVPWTSFNNTVVMGSLLLGLGLFYPFYHFSKYLFETYTEPVTEYLEKYRIYKVLFGTEIATRWQIQ